MQGLNLVRKVVLGSLDVAADRQTCIDSMPIPVVNCYYAPAPRAASEWKTRGARFGRVASKRKVIFGYKLHMLVTLGGVILDFEMAPANLTDLAVGQELLQRHHDLDAVADKGYISYIEPVAQELMQGNNICLFINRALGKPHFLQIKQLAFPI
jgi:hypothetical protein